MKKLIIIIALINCFIGFSQNSREFLDKFKELRQAELSEKQSIEGVSSNSRRAKLSSITAKYQDLESKLRSKYITIEKNNRQTEKISTYQNSSNSYNGNLMLQQMQK